MGLAGPTLMAMARSQPSCAASENPSGRAALDRVVEFVQRQLPLDVAYVAELQDDRLLYRAVAGDAASFNITLNEARAAGGTYCQRLVAGEIPTVVRDALGDQGLIDLGLTREPRIGSYIGVPLRLPDGTLYGTLCCLGREPNQALDERDARLLSMLGELIVDDLEELRRRDALRRELLHVIEMEHLDVAYQPIFDLRGDRCLGMEALARFPEPFARPDRTFAAAAQVGLELELERLVVHKAWKMLSRLKAGQFLALNVSPASLLELARRANRYGALPLQKLVVEVTEHAAVQAYSALRSELAPLRQRGLRIAVDDAGAGYASLRHVVELRPDFIKLDRWLIHGLADDCAKRVAVGAFVSLARELRSSVVAEGVERPADLSAARELGVDAAQGYLLGRPTTDEDAVSQWCGATKGVDGARAGVGAFGEATPLAPVPLAAAEPLVGGVMVADSDASHRAGLAHELERLELNRRVSHHLEAVGQLAAGIAHEINTPLQFVGDSVTFLKDAVDELVALTGLYRETLYTDASIAVQERRRRMREAERRADVEYLCERIPAAFERTADGIARVRSIVQAMKRFSHASTTDAAPADINEAIETTLVVCRNEYKYVADIELELGDVPVVTCNIGELNQVFLNLVINAAQAIEEKTAGIGPQGQIRISTRLDGAEAVIEIADDGPGIPPALQDRIYEPFFTTKQVGKGTGQGLALARATIERHRGSLECVSVLGEGTTFTIRLPLQPPSREITAAA